MYCFGDISKHIDKFDNTLNLIKTRFNKCLTKSTNVLITESVNTVVCYSTEEGFQSIENWVFPHVNRLVCPVITCVDISDGIEYLIAVQEPKTLTKWSFGDQKAKPVEKYFFSKRIIGLIGFDVENTFLEPIVVFDKGFCQSLSNAIKTRGEDNKQEVINKEECIQFIDGLRNNQMKDYLIIYLITKTIDSNESTIKSIYKLMICCETDVIVKTERQEVVNTFTNWSLSRTSATILAINRSDDGLVVYSLNGKTETKLFNLNVSSIKSIVSICVTSLGSVCLIGKTKDSNYLMELWEQKYGSKLGQIDLPYEPMTNDCTVINDSVLITCFKGILLVPIRTQTIKLSQIVGKNRTKDTTGFESEMNKQLQEICEDFKTSNDKTFDEINERFEHIVEQIRGNIPEDVILELMTVCTTKLSQTDCKSFKRLFQRLVSLPFNELFMISKLKSLKIEFKQILLTLKLLSDLLPFPNSAIIDWISILIDSHLNEFILNPNADTIQVIEQIDDKIENCGQFFEQLGEIKTTFDIIVAKNNDKNSLNNGLNNMTPLRGQYCIEFLRF